jgi:DNA polymerase-3 subunit epsilon
VEGGRVTVPWFEIPMTVLDIESTSKDPTEARIVTAAVGYVGGGKPTDLHTLVSAVEFDIPEEATQIHGWTTKRAREEGIPPSDVLDVIMGMIDGRPAGGVVVAFQAAYDLTVTDHELMREGKSYPWHTVPVVDPLLLDRHLDKYRPGKRDLATTCEHYRRALGRPKPLLDAAHQAGADAIATARLAYVIGRFGQVARNPRYPDERAELEALRQHWRLVKDDAQQLHAFQQDLAATDAASLEAYFRKGNEKKDIPPQPGRIVERDWPVLSRATPRCAVHSDRRAIALHGGEYLCEECYESVVPRKVTAG